MNDVDSPDKELKTIPKSLNLKKGELFGQNYCIVKFIGRGGFGAVYEVHDLRTKEPFALKVCI